jgi:hypothetical protein
MHAGVLAAIAYFAAVIACLAAPIAGFIFNRRGKAGLAVAWLPPAAAMVALIIPAPYKVAGTKRYATSFRSTIPTPG